MASTPCQEKFGGLSFSGGKVRSPPGCSRVVQEEGLLTTPGSARSGRSSLSDEAMCVRLREAGFDQESIKKRDKAALIGYIARLESEGWTIYKILRYSPLHNWAAYEEVLKPNPVLAKMVISGVVYSLGDWIAQCVEGNPIFEFDQTCMFRSGLVEFSLHGSLSHYYYQFCEALFRSRTSGLSLSKLPSTKLHGQ